MVEPDRAEELIQRHLDEVATAEETAELGRLVAERGEVAEALLEAARLDVLLTLHLGGTRPADSAHRPQGRRPLARRPLLVAVLASAAALWIGLCLSGWSPRPAGHPILAGRVEVDGSPATRVVDGAPLRVVGGRPAVIRLAGGARAELEASTAAVIRPSFGSEGQLFELLEGGGRFHVPRRADRPLCVRTTSGSVTGASTDFEVNLWSTEGKGDEEMSFRNMFVLFVAVAAGTVQVDIFGEKHVLSAGAQQVFGAEPDGPKIKTPGPSWQPSGVVLGFTGKGGQPAALEGTVPGIQGALQLSDEQKKKIAAAMDQTINSAEVRSAGAVLKLNPSATEAQREEARKVLDAARAKLRELVAGVLTPEQKKLVPAISDAGWEVQKEVREAMQAEIAAAKGDKAKMAELDKQIRQKVTEAVQPHLKKLLTPAQLASYKKAAETQIAAELEANKRPKGKK